MSIALVALLLTTSPMADVWPYQAKHLPDGRIEYSYDLTLLKQKPAPVETVANHGDKEVKAFLAGLPREVKLTVKPGAQVELRGGRPLEPKPLVPSFSQVSDAPYSSSDPLGRTPKNRLRPALAPEEPKVLVTAEAVLWRVRRFEDGALGALLLDSDTLGQQLWTKVIDKAQAKRRNGGGDAVEGALLLVARVMIAQAQGDAAKVPKVAATDGALAQVLEQELKALADQQDALLPWRYEGWTPELKAAAVRAHLFGGVSRRRAGPEARADLDQAAHPSRRRDLAGRRAAPSVERARPRQARRLARRPRRVSRRARQLLRSAAARTFDHSVAKVPLRARRPGANRGGRRAGGGGGRWPAHQRTRSDLADRGAV
jgi:hypothetical protein